MIIDSFVYNGEAEMLAFRLAMLGDYVDMFIIVESTHTFSGKHKKLTFDSIQFPLYEKVLYHPFTPRLEGLNFDSKPTRYEPAHDCWQIEYQQRNAILSALDGFSGDDTLIISDVDEIPSREVIKLAHLYKKQPAVCTQAFFYYSCKYLRQEQWNGSIITTVRNARNETPQGLRNKRNELNRIEPGGWHLSYFGDIKSKIEAFSHQELNVPEFKNATHIEKCKQTGADLFNRGTESVAVDKSFFPKYFVDNAPESWW